MENDLDILSIHKIHPPTSFGLFMFHCFNISKHISISALFYIISVLSFVFFLLDCFKIIQSRGLGFSTIFLSQVSGFRTFLCLGVRNPSFQNDSPRELLGGWSGLELTDTLVLGIARTVSRLRSQVNLQVHFKFAFGILCPSTERVFPKNIQNQSNRGCF